MNYNPIMPMSFRSLPPVVKNLLLINAIFFLASEIIPPSSFDVLNFFAMHRLESEAFRPYQVVTHIFIHFGFGHFALNMFALWLFGAKVEEEIGPQRFFLYYFVCAFGAVVFHEAYLNYQLSGFTEFMQDFIADPNPEKYLVFMDKYARSEYHESMRQFANEWSAFPNDQGFINSAISSVQSFYNAELIGITGGASGAVFGVLLAFGVMFPLARLNLLIPPISLQARYLVIIYGGFELYMAYRNNPDDSVAHFAHLGGMFFGYFLIKFWMRNRFRRN